MFRNAARSEGPLALVAGAVLCAVGFAAPLGPAQARIRQQAGRQDGFTTIVKPLVSKFCAPCHGGASPAAGLNLAKFKDKSAMLRASRVWEKVARNLKTSTMPPKDMPQPKVADRQRVAAWVESTLAGERNPESPGSTTVRRLNRNEYDNTVRDLTGLDLKLAREFPSDDVGSGFDNVADVLSTSTLHIEKYLAAAEQIATRAIPIIAMQRKRFELAQLPFAIGSVTNEEGDRLLFSNSRLEARVDISRPGSYVIRVIAYAQQAGAEPAKMRFDVDGKGLAEVEVKESVEKPGSFEASVDVPRDVPVGERSIGVSFVNDYYEPTNPNRAKRDRNLIVRSLELLGPYGARPESTKAQRLILGARPLGATDEACAEDVIRRFGMRAWRRPITPAEKDRLMRLYRLALKENQPYEGGIRLIVQALLSSPNFLYRSEQDPGSGQVRDLSGYEIASRLSYFLWSSMPDDTLFKLAASGKLMNPTILEQQVDRMLQDPKATALAEDFAAQWLQLRLLSGVSPDPDRFPQFDAAMRDAMATETKLFFMGIVRENRSVIEFLSGDYSFLNQRLAKLYGVPGVTGDEFRKVNLANLPRAGVITQASVLTITSNPTRTSPVKRGKWILGQLLGTPPAPPPPGVGDLGDSQKPIDAATVRKRLEMHRAKPACASCHVKMDPLGMALENFDPIGAWRTADGGMQIDAEGTLPDGTRFVGPVELRKLLLTRKADFVKNFAEKLGTYALGRDLNGGDSRVVANATKRAVANGYRLSEIVKAIVLSDSFRRRASQSLAATRPSLALQSTKGPQEKKQSTPPVARKEVRAQFKR